MSAEAHDIPPAPDWMALNRWAVGGLPPDLAQRIGRLLYERRDFEYIVQRAAEVPEGAPRMHMTMTWGPEHEPVWVFEYGPDWVSQYDLPGARLLPGAMIRDILRPVSEIPTGAQDWRGWTYDTSKVRLAGLVMRRELVAETGTTLVWDRLTGAWSQPPADTPPIEAQVLDWTTRRLSGQRHPGRPPSSGEQAIARRAAFINEVEPAIRHFRAQNKKPGRERVAAFLYKHLTQPDTKLKRRAEKAGFPRWSDVLAAIPKTGPNS